MARFHDKVGFLIPIDNQETGIVSTKAVERSYYGRVLEHTRRWDSSEHLNDDLRHSNQIAITANDYAFKHMSSIAYVHWMHGYWKVDSIRVKAPEIVLTLGGVWNGTTAASAKTAHAGAQSLVPETSG